METLAFTQVVVDFEDPCPAAERRIPDIGCQWPRAAVGVAGSAAALSILATAPGAQAIIRRGDFCSAVGAVQSALAELDYAPGGIDDDFGLSTERAVQNFQRNNDITPDGVVGPTTAAALGLPPSPYAIGAGCNGGGGGGGGAGLASVSADVLNVRSGPALTSPVVGQLFQGTQVQVLRTAGSWSEISTTSAGEAWVASAYLSGAASSIGNGSNSGSGSGGGGGIVSTDSGNGANVRALPNGPRVYGLPDGAVVRLNGVTRVVEGTAWSQLTDGNWIASFVLA